MFSKTSLNHLILSVLIITLLSLVHLASSDDDLNKNRTYISLKQPIPCVRRFNSTHQFGCGKLDDSSYEGMVYAVRNDSELEHLHQLIETYQNKFRYKIVIATVGSMFPQVVEYYKKSKQFINGIVLSVVSDQDNVPYSDDAPSPNRFFSIYGDSSSAWNPTGSGFMFESFDIPFYLVTDPAESNSIFVNCFDQFNAPSLITDFKNVEFSKSMCGIQLGMQMSGSVSSSVCARRNSIQHTLDPNYYCDPLGGSSYFTFLSQQPSNDLPITLVTARMDTFTMYESYTPGANEPISSLIGILTLMDVLARNRDSIDLANVLFVFFDNDAFDYAGSSRFVYDLVKDQFPSFDVRVNQTHMSSFKLQKGNITTMIELNQLGSVGLDVANRLFIHRDPISYAANKTIAGIIDNLVEKLANFSNQMIQSVTDLNQQLPPSSLHSFLRPHVEHIQLAGVTINDHQIPFKNKFYHGVFDTPANMNIKFPPSITETEAETNTTLFAQQLKTVITAIAKTIYSASSSSSLANANLDVDIRTINKLVYCFYKNTTCDFFKNILSSSQWTKYNKILSAMTPTNSLSFYTSVNENAVSGKWISLELLRFFSRNRQLEALNGTECDKSSKSVADFESRSKQTIRNFKFVNNSTCVASSVYSVSSVSPAFEKFYSDGVLVQTDIYSTWTESSWNGVAIPIKLFLLPEKSIEILTISLGVTSFLLAAVLTYLVNRYSGKIFSSFSSNADQTTSTQLVT